MSNAFRAYPQNGHGHQHHPHRRLNLGECETEDEVLDAIEQSRRVTRLIISAVQKGSNFEVSQILEHYGMPMTSRLHFKVVAIVMEQWFSLMGIEDEDKIWNILRRNEYAMDKLRSICGKGTMVISDLLTEWELPIGGLQSKIIRHITDHIDAEQKLGKKIFPVDDNNNNNKKMKINKNKKKIVDNDDDNNKKNKDDDKNKKDKQKKNVKKDLNDEKQQPENNNKDNNNNNNDNKKDNKGGDELKDQ